MPRGGLGRSDTSSKIRRWPIRWRSSPVTAPSRSTKATSPRDIAKAVQSDPRQPGTLTAQDLANYHAKEREPVCAPYRAYRVCGAGPPSSGARRGRRGARPARRRSISAPRRFNLSAAHAIAEAERLAFADRARYLADPDFVAVPVGGLLDPAYLAERRALIDPDRAQSEVAAGSPPNVRQGAFGSDATKERAAPAKSPWSTMRATPSP